MLLELDNGGKIVKGETLNIENLPAPGIPNHKTGAGRRTFKRDKHLPALMGAAVVLKLYDLRSVIKGTA